jgi:hypothetical protein
MSNSVEPLPDQPEQKQEPHHPAPLVRLTVYGTEAVLLVALANPVHDLPYGIQHDNPHTETKKPSTRVDNVRQIARVSSLAANINVVGISYWPPPGG